ncbi:kinesin [Angomonas deanei]|nr:kinesin [Angomonas deanei]EPY36760.1 kinesin [Angomonas deanei]|eukprot:EPY24434.1 kinesin [Angomonas deanei]
MSASNEPKLVQAPKRRGSKKASTTPTRPDRRSSLTTADAAEGTDAFKNRISEITSFKVVSRVRPFIEEELAEMKGQERRSVVEMMDNKTILLDPKDNWNPKAQFEFDASLWSIPASHKLVHTYQDTRKQEFSSQLDVYNNIAKDLVPHVFNGFNSCILTYGQTGSGKTYTMMGKYDPNATIGEDGEEGIIPRVSNDLFQLLAERTRKNEEEKEGEKVTFRVEVSFVEIYMERVRDLLDPALRHTRGNEKLQDARIRQDPYSGPFVEGVTKYQVENWAQCCTLLERGSQHRTTCATAVHNQSSRSHAIYQITVIQEQTIPAKDRYSQPSKKTQAGRINLVDLAGSERGGFQDYVKESAAINTSLLALRRVIDNLTERQNMLIEQAKAEITGGYYNDRPLPQVPFRDSVLTWLLSDSIGGNARTTMVATLSPLVKNYGDTLATLQWSSKARNLVTLVKMNDQSVVQDGMTQHAGDLGNAVQIQRQNLDSLRETLQYKKQMAEKYEKDAEALQKDLKKEQLKLKKVQQDRAALIIQRAYRRYRHENGLVGKGGKGGKGTSNADEEYQRLERQLKEVQKKEEQSKRQLEKEMKATKDLEARLAEKESQKDALQARREAAQEIKDKKYEELDADTIRREHAEKVKKELETAKGAVQKAEEKKQKNKEQLEAMRKTIEASKTPEWAANIQKDKEDLTALRAKRDELKQKLDLAIAERDAVRAVHAKKVKKSK